MIVLTSLLFIPFVAGNIAKILRVQQVVDGFTKIGVGEYTQLLGVFELAFFILFLFPKTMRTGFLLLSCFMGGAIATHISHGDAPFQPLFPLILLWITAYLKDPYIFLYSPSKSKSSV